MKKLLAIILTALLLVSVAAVSASAYGRRQIADCRRNAAGFVDSDNDGICDNRPASGKCQYTENNCGANFTDSDNDGICDNRPASGKCQYTENNCGTNFTDSDNDGICDNRPTSGKGKHCGKNR